MFFCTTRSAIPATSTDYNFIIMHLNVRILTVVHAPEIYAVANIIGDKSRSFKNSRCVSVEKFVRSSIIY